jgi:enoyl-CoA hydratase/carnithine racemase
MVQVTMISCKQYNLRRLLVRAVQIHQQRPHSSSSSSLRLKHRSSVQRNAVHDRKRAQKICQAPASIAAVPADASDPVGNAGAFIRPNGCLRRVYLRNTHLSPAEIEGLAYRVRVLSSNEYLSSVLIATDNEDPRGIDLELSDAVGSDGGDLEDGYLFDPKPGHVWHAAGGYDPVQWYQSGKYNDTKAVEKLLNAVQDLALATLGHKTKSRIPIITIPHGAVTDSGYALCLSTYMCATEQTYFRILNPSRGLTFDPVGFSYLLPRLGQEFKQVAASFRGCGHILGLMGYEATPEDMMETGLATHYMENPVALMGTLERTLSLLPPWNQQMGIRKPPQLESDRQQFQYRAPDETPDFNREFRNVAVASTMNAFSQYDARGSAPFDGDVVEDDPNFPAAFDFDPLPTLGGRESDLVNYAGTFDEIFQRSTLEGMLEGFREIAGRITNDPEEQEGIDVAADFVRRLEEQAPLALRVTHKLLNLGDGPEETIHTCMAREKAAQTKLMAMADYQNWAKTQVSMKGRKAKKFMEWQHQTVADVTEDEVSEVMMV